MAKKEMLTTAEIDNISTKTGKELKSEEKVKIKIPADPLNPKNKTVPVCINGYNYFIKRGESVSVPNVVAELLETAGYI